MIEPGAILKVMSPRVIKKADQQPLLCLINQSDKYCLINKGLHNAEAYQKVIIIIDANSNNSNNDSKFETIY